MPVMSVQWKGLSPMSLRAPVRATACCLHTALLYLCQSRAGVPNFLSEAVGGGWSWYQDLNIALGALGSRNHVLTRSSWSPSSGRWCRQAKGQEWWGSVGSLGPSFQLCSQARKNRLGQVSQTRLDV